LDEKIHRLKVDVLIIAGKESPHFEESSKFFSILTESRKNDFKKLVNCTFLELDESRNVLHDHAGQIATSIIYFLQGIGLLSAVPMTGLHGKGVVGGKSMEDSDKPL
jgi:hypothetical protein